MKKLKIYDKLKIENLTFEPEASFEDSEFENTDFTEFDLKSVSFLDCKFTNCNLANQSLMNVTMRGVIFEDCNLIGINWCDLSSLDYPKFINSKLNFSTFQSLKLKKLELINCSALDVGFSGADLSFANFAGSNFAGANFNNATLIGADFRTSRDYLFDLRTTKVKDAKFSLPHVISLITALGAVVET